MWTYIDVMHLMQRDSLTEREAAEKLGMTMDEALEMGLAYAVDHSKTMLRIRELMQQENITIEAAATRLGVDLEDVAVQNTKAVPGVA